MNCMRYNPLQAQRLLLDPLIILRSAKFERDFQGVFAFRARSIPRSVPWTFYGYVPSG